MLQVLMKMQERMDVVKDCEGKADEKMENDHRWHHVRNVHQ